jgi:hypothetical protein
LGTYPNKKRKEIPTLFFFKKNIAPKPGME